MKSKKPLKTKLDGVSPGCTLLLKKNIWGGEESRQISSAIVPL